MSGPKRWLVVLVLVAAAVAAAVVFGGPRVKQALADRRAKKICLELREAIAREDKIAERRLMDQLGLMGEPSIPGVIADFLEHEGRGFLPDSSLRDAAVEAHALDLIAGAVPAAEIFPSCPVGHFAEREISKKKNAPRADPDRSIRNRELARRFDQLAAVFVPESWSRVGEARRSRRGRAGEAALARLESLLIAKAEKPSLEQTAEVIELVGREDATVALAGLAAPPPPEGLLAALKHRSPCVRADALDHLGSKRSLGTDKELIARPEITAAVLGGLDAGEVCVRRGAIAAALYVFFPGMAPGSRSPVRAKALALIRDDPDAIVREKAETWLRSVPDLTVEERASLPVPPPPERPKSGARGAASPRN